MTVASSHAFLLDDVVRHGLFQLVSEAQQLMDEIEALQTKLEERGYIAQKTRWAMKDARIATQILLKLEGIEDGLTKWMAFVSL
jgi:cell division septum initiation protein DivIVA